jgi:bacterioferritin-associated ferredoxin
VSICSNSGNQKAIAHDIAYTVILQFCVQIVLTIILIYIKTSPMYVCLCKAVTEQQICTAIDEGAVSLQDLQKQLSVATQCGACAGCARTMLNKYRRNKYSLRQSSENTALPLPA